MALIRIDFDGGDVPVLSGEEPDSPTDPIVDPVDTNCMTNAPFVFPAGFYCFALDTDLSYAPLWQTGQAIDGKELLLKFRRTQP